MDQPNEGRARYPYLNDSDADEAALAGAALEKLLDVLSSRPLSDRLSGDDAPWLIRDMFATAFVRTGVIIFLIERGWVREAAVLARSIADVLFSAAYLVAGAPEEREARRLQFVGFRNHLVDVGLRGLADGLPPPPDAGEPRKWSGVSIETMAREGGTLDVYKTLYFHLSNYEHTTPHGIETMRRDDPLIAVLIRTAATGAAVCLARIADLMARAQGQPPYVTGAVLAAYESTRPPVPR